MGFFELIIGIVVIIFDIIAISNVLNSNRDTLTKLVLIVLIIFFPCIGAGVYLLVFRDKGYV